MKKKRGRGGCMALILVVLAAIVAGAYYYGTFLRGNVVAGGGDKDIFIYHGYGLEETLAAFSGSGILRDESSLQRAARHLRLGESIRPGRYRFAPGSSNRKIVRAVSHGWQTPVRLTFNGHIRSLNRLCGIFARQLEADSLQFVAAFGNSDRIASLGFNKATFIGMFVPNTYEVWWTASPDEIISRMKNEYDAFWTQSRLEKAAAAGLTPQEVTTLASIVAEETQHKPEMPIVAGVYINRLKKGMPLQADPTVKFAVGDEQLKRILNTHLEVDSPYNTYKHRGLPPGPITIPTIAAIDAVLNYQKHDYLYFCAKPTFDGQHSFAVTHAQHQQNAAAYHSALNSRKNKEQ